MRTKVALIIAAGILSSQPAVLLARKHQVKTDVCSVSTVWFPGYAGNFSKPDLEEVHNTFADMEAGRMDDDETVERKRGHNRQIEAEFKRMLELKTDVEDPTWLKVVTWGTKGAGTLEFSSGEGGVYSHEDSSRAAATGRTGTDVYFTLALKDAAGEVVWQKEQRQFEGTRSYATNTTAGAYEVYADPDRSFKRLLSDLARQGRGCRKQ